jgi:hypothetical protein
MTAPYFYPKKFTDKYEAVIEKAYNAAKAEAKRIATLKGIACKIEFLKPVHLNRTLYNLPGSTDTQYTLKTNCAIFPFGILNEDPTFDYMKWWKGAKTSYIGDWFVRPVYLFEEKEGVYAGNLDQYVVRGDETFTINCHSTTSSPTINAWLLAFAVMPVTLEEVQIIQ